MMLHMAAYMNTVSFFLGDWMMLHMAAYMNTVSFF